MFTECVVTPDSLSLISQPRRCSVYSAFQEVNEFIKSAFVNVVSGIAKFGLNLGVDCRIRKRKFFAINRLSRSSKLIKSLHQIRDIIMHIHIRTNGFRRMSLRKRFLGHLVRNSPDFHIFPDLGDVFITNLRNCSLGGFLRGGLMLCQLELI